MVLERLSAPLLCNIALTDGSLAQFNEEEETLLFFVIVPEVEQMTTVLNPESLKYEE